MKRVIIVWDKEDAVININAGALDEKQAETINTISSLIIAVIETPDDPYVKKIIELLGK